MKAMILLALAAVLLGAPLPHASAESRSIRVHTTVTKWGQMPDRFIVSGQPLPDGVTAESFTIDGKASAWGAAALHPFSCGVKAIHATEDGWELIPERFPDKYFYVRELAVSCSALPELGFTLQEIGKTETDTADSFFWYRDAAGVLDAHVFLPEPDGPVPVVAVFHGYGDTEILLTYRTAVPWAEPANQAVRPCIVIAPVIPSDRYPSALIRGKVLDAVMAYITVLAEQGLADPSRIYAVGNSFGGMTAFEMAERFPGRIAALLALCPALNYSPEAQARLTELKDIPVTIAQAERDETIPVQVARDAAAALREAGNTGVSLRIYTDAEMEAAGARHGFSETYSFHHVELAVMEDESYFEWLFAQRLP